MEDSPTTVAMNSGTITSEVFFRELSTFRKIMQDVRNSITKMDEAYGCLFLIINRVDPKDPRKELVDLAWDSISDEFGRRKFLLMANGHPVE